MGLPIVSEALSLCPADRAVYHLRTGMETEFTAGFARQDPRKAGRYDLVFWLRTPLRTYFFSFSEPQRFEGGGPFISPEFDPKRAAAMDDHQLEYETGRVRGELALEFDTFSPELYEWGVPAIVNPPPALIVARGLARALRERPHELAGGDYRAEPEIMPSGLFLLSECAAAPH
ncbi:MAG: hypothetical protein QOJ27_1590 [Sphingomonadales bacterium]|nr:hypothetical protein [Sphingomonadales bacterium]